MFRRKKIFYLFLSQKIGYLIISGSYKLRNYEMNYISDVTKSKRKPKMAIFWIYGKNIRIWQNILGKIQQNLKSGRSRLKNIIKSDLEEENRKNKSLLKKLRFATWV